MVMADTLFSEQDTHTKLPLFGEMAPTRSYVHLKITFSTSNKAAQDEFGVKFAAFINECIERQALPINEYQEAEMSPTNSGFYLNRAAVKTEIILTSHLTDQEFKDFAAAVQALLEDMPNVMKVRCSNHHHHVLITATGLERY